MVFCPIALSAALLIASLRHAGFSSAQEVLATLEAAPAADACDLAPVCDGGISQPGKGSGRSVLWRHRRRMEQVRCEHGTDCTEASRRSSAYHSRTKQRPTCGPTTGPGPLRYGLLHRNTRSHAFSSSRRQSFRSGTLRQWKISLRKRVVFLWTSDEEIGSEASRKFFEAEARRSDAVFVLEPSFGR